jgi:hypothetical protein
MQTPFFLMCLLSCEISPRDWRGTPHEQATIMFDPDSVPSKRCPAYSSLSHALYVFNRHLYPCPFSTSSIHDWHCPVEMAWVWHRESDRNLARMRRLYPHSSPHRWIIPSLNPEWLYVGSLQV